jgi:diguanylate cyclase (GGDEF)-like protein
LRRAVRGEDYVSRIGGDEFVIVVPPDANASFEGLARRLLRAIEQPMVLPGGVAATVGMSIGHAELVAGLTPDGALRAADEEMYKMKSRLPTRTTADTD